MGKKFPKDFEKFAAGRGAPSQRLPAAEIKARMEGMRLAWQARNAKAVRKVRKKSEAGQPAKANGSVPR